MATLKGVEGRAHVESDDALSNWRGRIILDPDLGAIRQFDIAGPASEGIYEGPVKMQGKFILANGNVTITKVNFSSTELRVEFVGIGKLSIINPLSTVPDDYLP